MGIEKQIAGAMLGGALIVAGCCNCPSQKTANTEKALFYKIEKHDVDQVYRDHKYDAYRVNYTDEDKKVVDLIYFEDGEDSYRVSRNVPFPEIKDKEAKMFKGFSQKDQHIKIYKDLEYGSQGHALVLQYHLKSHINQLYYVEVHLPEKGSHYSTGRDTMEVK